MEQRRMQVDVVVVGGSLGGTAAALSAAECGMKVIMTEATDWIGGQLTSQAVPPDEHRWIEQFGCTLSYRKLRERIRSYYKSNYPLTKDALDDPLLNPGNGWVSRLSHEPRVALSVLQDMLAPYVNSGRVQILYHTVPVAADTVEDMITGIEVLHLKDQTRHYLQASYYLDATDCGDLLPLAGAEYVVGAESRQDTHEPHAPEHADQQDVQGITHVAAVDYTGGWQCTIERPADYEFWKGFMPRFSTAPLLSWYAADANDTTRLKEFTMFPNEYGVTSLWDYRRIVDPKLWSVPLFEGEVTLLNWPQNDYFIGSIMDVADKDRASHLEAAVQLTLSLVYWLQTEAPRLDGGIGFPGVRLRGDVLGTVDGLAKAPYIRESRRLKAMQTITEHDVSKQLRGEKGIRRYADSVGVGSYHLDIHPTTITQRTYYIPNYPYEIPLGSLIPIRMKNLIAACKNIGMTQVANGCYRLHPTEWNIGEAAGVLAAYAIQHQICPAQVRESNSHLSRYQEWLLARGVKLHWPLGMEFTPDFDM
ncbi:FAD-dependent oxidoreductase [Paenibacillus massiliensis]|uniref:FAD-dependent oxidoreductase n=1 Tax=Paenibacillus massiliensis TaxID=225917 RepID=UPI00035CA51F|nr:FAD-dependent oxidoreductase [Paenibacillus massiliensis]